MATGEEDYAFGAIEGHWQAFWEREKTFRAEDFSERPKYYVLDMYPYPSGEGLHVGHPEGYTASDILARYKRARGFNVLHPMGWDAFGLPAEQHALKTGTHPAETTAKNIANFKRQIKSIGFAIDWEREVNTTDPGYYRWTQWIFQQLFRRGLAYVDERPVWWCPALGTVLANEEVIDGRSERGDHPVERRNLRQWVLRITAHADRLIEGLETVDWPDSTKRQQKEWIGRSEGAEVTFDLDGHPGERLEIYTTRPDTLFGATYMVLAPEHPLVDVLTVDARREAVSAYVGKAASKSDLDRTAAKKKSGVDTGAFAINPVNGEKIPVWVADYVLMTYGTGAIMAVPAHDERDHEFALAFELPIVPVIENAEENPGGALPFVGQGRMVNSGAYDGLGSAEGKAKITADLEAEGRGRAAVNYKLRDWLFSRQRYWGEPFPVLWVDEEAYRAAAAVEGGAVAALLPDEPVTYEDADGQAHYALALPTDQLPLALPETDSYQPSGTGESPLATIPEWADVFIHLGTGETAPAAGGRPEGEPWVPARRETNTMPQWAGSCWYYLRYCDPHNPDALIAPGLERYWGVPDFYIGGAEHAVLHLLYARFWHQMLFDLGVVTTPEPFSRLFHQGLILGEMEYILYRDAAGEPVSFHKDIDREGLTSEGLEESAVEKREGGTYVLAGTDTAVEAKCFKMSKARGNVINPDEVIERYGADSLRLYEMFMGPLQDMKPWSMGGIDGVHRFLRKVWRLFIDREGAFTARVDGGGAGGAGKEGPATERLLHETIKKVGEDIENLRFNTAISQMMIFVNHLQKAGGYRLETARTFIQLLAPFAPHIGEELWERSGGTPSVVDAPWPEYDPAVLASDEVKVIFQVMGKVRGEAMVATGASQEQVLALAREQPRVAAHIEGKTVRKVIYVPGKILNIVAN